MTQGEAAKAFIDECCVLEPDAWVPKWEIDVAYRKWCRQKKESRPISHVGLQAIIDTLPGIGRAVKNKGRASFLSYTGIRLKK